MANFGNMMKQAEALPRLSLLHHIAEIRHLVALSWVSPNPF